MIISRLFVHISVKFIAGEKVNIYKTYKSFLYRLMQMLLIYASLCSKALITSMSSRPIYYSAQVFEQRQVHPVFFLLSQPGATQAVATGKSSRVEAMTLNRSHSIDYLKPPLHNVDKRPGATSHLRHMDHSTY